MVHPVIKETITHYRKLIKDQKEDPNHGCITIEGNMIDYLFELTTCTADMDSSKILWNSVVSTKDACFAGTDVKNMYI